MKNINYEEIYKNLHNGYKYENKYDGYEQICLTPEGFIFWQHCGSSATEDSIEDLKFIIDVIFKEDFNNLIMAKIKRF